jgi:hypothetical protein
MRPGKRFALSVIQKSDIWRRWKAGQTLYEIGRAFDFPRGTDLSACSQAQLDQVSLRLNQPPRKTLGFQTPAGKLQQSVASTI